MAPCEQIPTRAGLVRAAALLSLIAFLLCARSAAAAPPHIEMGVDGQGRTVATVGPGPLGRTGVLRLNTAGRLDLDFATDGIIGPFPSKSPAAMSLARDGDVVVAEEPREGKSVLRRYSAADGSLDRRFGHHGSVAIPVVPANRVLVQPDGHVLIFYQEICPSSSCGYLLTYLEFYRYSPRGRHPKTHTRYQEEWTYEAVAMDPRGSFVVKGSDEEIGEQTFARFRPNGKLDPSLGGKEGLDIEPPRSEEGEQVEEPTSKREYVPSASHIAITADRGLVLTDESFGGSGEAIISRRKPTGYLEKSFGTDGKAICQLPEGTSTQMPFDAVAVAPDNSILAAGGIGPCGLVRFTPTGQLDPAFGTGGEVDLEALGLPRAATMSLAPDGDVVVGGWNPKTKAAEFARLTPDGHLDPTFGSGGITSVSGF
jgi:uncharacterized delta-60 repeat protein